MSLQLFKLLNPEKHGGFTHYMDVDYTDLNDEAGTTKAIDIATVAAGHRVRDVGHRLLETFDGGDTSGLTLQLGYNAGSDDADGYMLAKELHEDGTEVAYGVADGVALTYTGGHVVLESTEIEALFTATGANLTELTQGRVRIFVHLVDLSKIVREYVAE